MNISLILIVLIAYYVVLMLFTGRVIEENVVADIFCCFSVIVSVFVLCSIFFYAMKYAGNPTASEKYKKIISKARQFIILFTVTRIVRFNTTTRLIP